MSQLSRIGHALYQGKVSIDFVGRRRAWYALSGLILLVAMSGLFFRGLNYGIEFEGGVEYRVSMPANQATDANVTKISDAVVRTGVEAASAPIVNTSGSDNIRVQTQPLTTGEADRVAVAIQRAAGVGEGDLSLQAIGATWGAQVAQRALIGLGVFTVLVILFIWAYFREWKMSVGAIVALIHDLVITIGIYALSGFEVTPATVTGVLTILGFSLYDTVVVFDKVRENTANLARTRQTYAEAANLAVNQTLVRSINTSIVALLPVGALLYVGVVTLGSGALKDLALALFVGMAVGAYSSIFIATPLVVQLKEREPTVQTRNARALKHRAAHSVDPFAHVPTVADDIGRTPRSARSAAGAGARGGRRAGGATALGVRDQEGYQDPLPDELDGNELDGPPAVDDDESVDGYRPVTPVAPPRGRGAGSTGATAARLPIGERGATRPVAPSASAKRAQPSRKPRSQRGGKK